ncbi:Glycosyltransferase involved in cell wall bisynthesis [Desulforamulus aeronauticus DSM 10349]|uniref:Glycosyltransferase involved in cell wall bisynthesis n=1 Tax=Desulforamulus aeronauticus DSM 10349 TaxID=1121421 RepID=A0A1M6PXQ4_9FIRM|nr:Glycosyltransferase involved in cell wall bisynthesis [Desulforamulus aeronauticus DSM 10349]
MACPPNSPLFEELANQGIKTLPISLSGELSPTRDYAAIHTLVKYLHQSGTTILHAHSSKGALVGRIAAMIARTPVVIFTAHNSIFYEEWPEWKKKLFASVERFLARFTDRIITVSDALKQELMEKEGIPAPQISIIYNGIEVENFAAQVDAVATRRGLAIPELGPVIGTIARLAPQKGVSYFLKAASLLKEYQVNFLVVGDGPLKEALEQEVAELSLQKRVIFAGKRENIAEILSIMDIFVLPSVTEGLPLSILEAMAAGKPVVATRVGGVPEAILEGKTGLVVAPKDPEALAVALAGMLSERDKLNRMGANGQKHVAEKFTIKHMADKTMELYAHLLAEKNLDTNGPPDQPKDIPGGMEG